MSPAITGDPLGHGRGTIAAMMAARTIINSAARSRQAKSGGKSSMGSAKTYSSTHNRNGGTSVGGTNVHNAGSSSNAAERSTSSSTANTNTSAQNAQTMQNSGSSRFGAPNTTVSSQSTASSRFGSANHNSARSIGTVSNGNTHFSSGGQTRINTNRFGAASGSFVDGSAGKPIGAISKTGGSGANTSLNSEKSAANTTNQKSAATFGKTPSQTTAQKEKAQGKKGAARPTGAMQKNSIRFGSLSEKARPVTTGELHQNVNPFKPTVGQPLKQIQINASPSNTNQTDNLGTPKEDSKPENSKYGDENG